MTDNRCSDRARQREQGRLFFGYWDGVDGHGLGIQTFQQLTN